MPCEAGLMLKTLDILKHIGEQCKFDIGIVFQDGGLNYGPQTILH